MTKFLSKWFRKFHRWIAVPTALAIPIAFVIKMFGDAQVKAIWERLDQLPSLLMLIMAISGAYLFLLPYIVRGQKKKRLAQNQSAGRVIRQGEPEMESFRSNREA